MPSAASSTPKCDPLVFAENMDPVNKVNGIITKRMANLEKRKVKLQHYKEELARGKDLNEDQRTAVKALDAVQGSIELCQYLIGQIEILIQEDAKLEKVKAKKLNEKRVEQEFQRVSSVLRVQDVLARLGQEEIRQDFLEGKKGAVKVDEKRLEQLDECYKLVTPPSGEDRDLTKLGFQNQLKKATENMISLLDGKSKSIGNGIEASFRDMRGTVNQISKSSYPKLPKSKETSNTPSPVPESENQLDRPLAEDSEEKNDEYLANGSGIVETTCEDIDNKSVISTSSQNKFKSKEPPEEIHHPTSPPGIPSMTIESTIISSHTIHNIEPHRLTEEEHHQNTQDAKSQLFFNQSHIEQQQLEQQQKHLQRQQQEQQQASMAINDIVACGGFNFLQESQVGPDQQQTSVYMDPAVVSFGSIKPEGLVQMHHQQSQQLSQVQQIHQQQKFNEIEQTNIIPSQSYQSSNSMRQPQYTPHNVSSTGYPTNEPSCPIPPIPPMSSQGRDKNIPEPNIERISEPLGQNLPSEPASREQRTSQQEEERQKIAESTSWADQSLEENTWNSSPHVNSNGGEEEGWRENPNWEEDEGKSYQNSEFERRGFNNRGRGNNGNFSRGGRGNNGGGGGYRGGRGRGGYGGGNYNNGGAGSNGNYRGGYRGGRGREGNDRGMGYNVGRGGNMSRGSGGNGRGGGGFRGRGSYNQNRGGSYQNPQ